MQKVWEFDSRKESEREKSVFLDKAQGNRYSHENRLFEFNSNQIPIDAQFDGKNTMGPKTNQALSFMKKL